MKAGIVRIRRNAFVAFMVASVAIGLIFVLKIWDLSPDGSSVATRKLPVFDFMNLWSGGRLAREGLIDVLFHRDAYNGWLTTTFGANVEAAEWSYPPTMLLIGAPLSLLPINAAYWAWTLATLAGLYLACRALGATRFVALAACVAPAAFVNVWFGQNGALTASLLIGGLALVERRPWLAGFLLGLLAMKPQTALLAPFAIVAAGAWRVVAAGALTALGAAALAAFAFTPEAWRLFFSETQPLMQGILEAPWPQSYQANGATIFALARAYGVDLSASYALQGAAAAICALVCIVLWRRGDLDIATKAAATAILTPLATPYGYVYDLVGFQAALLVLCARAQWRGVFVAAPVMLWAMAQPLRFVTWVEKPVAALFVAAGAVLATIQIVSVLRRGVQSKHDRARDTGV